MENSQSSGVNALHIKGPLILPEFGTEDFRMPVGPEFARESEFGARWNWKRSGGGASDTC